MRKIDPIERALDAYSALDADQKLIFGAALRHIERAIAQLEHGVDYCPPQDETKPRRGRPAGSKNRKMPKSLADLPLRQEFNPLAPETFDPAALFAQNGAVTEDL